MMNARPVERGSRTCYTCREGEEQTSKTGRPVRLANSCERRRRTLRDGGAFRAEEHADGTRVVLELLEEQGEVLLVGLPIAIQETHVELLDDGAERRNLART